MFEERIRHINLAYHLAGVLKVLGWIGGIIILIIGFITAIGTDLLTNGLFAIELSIISFLWLFLYLLMAVGLVAGHYWLAHIIILVAGIYSNSSKASEAENRISS